MPETNTDYDKNVALRDARDTGYGLLVLIRSKCFDQDLLFMGIALGDVCVKLTEDFTGTCCPWPKGENDEL